MDKDCDPRQPGPEPGPEPAQEPLSFGILGQLGRFFTDVIREAFGKKKIFTDISLGDGKGLTVNVNVTVLTASPVMVGKDLPRAAPESASQPAEDPCAG